MSIRKHKWHKIFELISKSVQDGIMIKHSKVDQRIHYPLQLLSNNNMYDHSKKSSI